MTMVSPGAGTSPPVSLFWWKTVTSPTAVVTTICVATPMYALSLTFPCRTFGAPSPSRIFSGLTPTATLPVRPAVSTVTTLPSRSRTLSVPSTAPPSRFDVPRKFATNAVRGRS